VILFIVSFASGVAFRILILAYYRMNCSETRMVEICVLAEE